MSAPLSPVRSYSVRHIETNVWEVIVKAASAQEAQDLAEDIYQAEGFEGFACIWGDTDIEVQELAHQEAAR